MKKYLKAWSALILAIFSLLFAGCVPSNHVQRQFESVLKEGDSTLSPITVFYKSGGKGYSGNFAVVDPTTAQKIAEGGEFHVGAGAGGTLWVWDIKRDTVLLSPKKAFLNPQKKKEKYSRQID